VYKNTPYQFNEYRKERYMEEINKQNEYWWRIQVILIKKLMQ
jgi:hypothetical protein